MNDQNRSGVLLKRGALGLLLLLGGVCQVSAAQSQLFVLLEDDKQLADVDALIEQVSVPVHVLNLGHMDELKDQVSEPLSFVAQMDEAEVLRNAEKISTITNTTVEDHRSALTDAYRNMIVAGEISMRYEVAQLPAIIEIDTQGRSRKIDSPDSFESGVIALEGMGFESAPPPLADTNGLRSEARSTVYATSRADPVAAVLPPPAPSEYSVLDAILDGSSPESYDCLELSISGVCTYTVVRVYCTPLGCSVEVTLEASFELTHSNPELMVASYKRLGGSPLEEARTLFGALQNELSGAAIGVMTGVDVPAEYNDPEKWAAWTSETEANGAAPSTLKYHEIDALGHPGTIFAHISADGLNPLPAFLAGLLEGPNNLIDGLKTSVSEIPPKLQEQSDVVDSITASLPTAGPVISGGPGTSTGGMRVPSGAELMTMAQSAFPDSIAEAAGRLLGLTDVYNTAMAAWEVGSVAATGDLTDAIGAVVDVDAISADLQAQVDKADEILNLINTTGDAFSSVGIGASGTELFSMCPGSNQFLKPYLLSGLDMTQWKFNIPEIVFPQTYAPPIPAFDDIYVGDLRYIGDDGLQVPNAWGSIYPRNGFIGQPDEMKAAAVAASRAAHVITRFGQKHVYSPLIPVIVKDLAITYPPAFSPVERESGKWQQLVPELDDQCYVFGDDDRVLSPWTKNRQTDDRDYVFALWRQYSCCPEPRRQGATVFTVVNLGTLPLDVDLLN